ncbi:hypothetical protein H7K24_17660 [Mycobacterium fragae]|uniref:Uncharacterized protein n=1 Tax=Mycobacterium fragae TaxID=1260918 RepID=A0A1X1UQS6_9MYCO|nr:hypothetical protein [Mycobacterium fragae]MCV7401972.1 hypothetical protein [Mycobacterium fragae]ORV59215.1 hypothetical protein AWC06_17770 [Mycobacterium fragae]
MADRLDVAARLAEGRLAVEHTQTYVRACHVLDYQHPDLTAHDSQVCDWYDTEAGLDLRVLDHDTAELWAAVNAIDEALNVQRTQLDELAAAWRGPSADSATRFLRRHCDTAATVAAHVRTAAERCGALRDELWQLIDGKAATAIAIDDRRVAERSAWLAAAHTVTTGAGDASAEELVRRQVNPYVDNDIRVDWLTAMRSTMASVAAAYEGATGALTHVAEACFELPGELGPSWQPVVDEPVADSAPLDAAPAVSTMPAAVSAPPPPTTVAPPTLPADPLAALPPVPPELAAPLGDAAGLSTGAGTLGGSGGLGGLAGNIGGVVGKIVDGIGGLIGSLADGFGDLAGDPLDADEADEPDELDDKDVEPDGKDDEPDEADDAEADDATSETDDENSPPADDAADEPAAQEAIPPPPDPPPPAEPVPVEPPAADPSASTPEPAAEGSTPCEIAAEELPQAGQ